MDGTKKDSLLRNGMLFLLVFVAFSGALRNDFAYDDVPRIAHSIRVGSWSQWWQSVGHGMAPGDLYRPFFELTLLINRMVAGVWPLGFHLIDLVIHAGNTCLLGFVFSELCGRSVAYTAASIYAVHPALTEAVANVSGRAETLVLWWGMVSVWCALTYLRHGGGAALVGWLLSAAVTIFTKENGVLYFGVVVLFWWYLLPTGTIKRGKLPVLCWVYGGLMVVWFLVRVCLLRQYAFGGPVWSIDNQLVAVGAPERVANAIYLLGRYLTFVVYPHNLTPECSFDPCRIRSFPFSLPEIIVVCVVLVLGLVGCFAVYRRWVFGFGIIWFFLLFATTANIASPIGTIFAERLLYAPSFGLILALIAIGDALLRHSALRTCCLVTMLPLCIVRSWEQVPVWRSTLTVATAGFLHGPRSPRAQWGVGGAALVSGDYRRAVQLLHRAHAGYPYLPAITVELGLAEMMNHRRGFARRYLRAGGGYNFEHHPTALVGAGQLMWRRGDLSRALRYADRAMQLFPEAIEPRLLAFRIHHHTRQRALVQADCSWFLHRSLTPCWDIYRFLQVDAVNLGRSCGPKMLQSCSVRRERR